MFLVLSIPLLSVRLSVPLFDACAYLFQCSSLLRLLHFLSVSRSERPSLECSSEIPLLRRVCPSVSMSLSTRFRLSMTVSALNLSLFECSLPPLPYIYI